MPIIVPTRDRLNVRTIALSELASALLHKLNYVIRPNSTLNENLGHLTNVTPANAYPEVKYFALGCGGHGFEGTSTASKIVYYQHDPDDAALWNQVPFVLRTLGNDLMPEQRARYAMRKEVVYGGVTYIAYYLRRIDTSRCTYVTNYRNIENGIVTETPYESTPSRLQPAKKVASTTGVNITSGDFLVTSTRLSLDITSDDVTELLNVFDVVYNDLDLARISEIAVCSGVDHLVTVSASTGQFNFLDAVKVQVMVFISDDRPLRFNTRGWARDVDMGSNIPMLRLRT